MPSFRGSLSALDAQSGELLWKTYTVPEPQPRGAIRWVNQFTVDVWSGGCGANSDANPNCPANVGPDIDFSASPILTTTEQDRDLLVIPQKSGELHALDPDNEGATLWTAGQRAAGVQRRMSPVACKPASPAPVSRQALLPFSHPGARL